MFLNAGDFNQLGAIGDVNHQRGEKFLHEFHRYNDEWTGVESWGAFVRTWTRDWESVEELLWGYGMMSDLWIEEIGKWLNARQLTESQESHIAALTAMELDGTLPNQWQDFIGAMNAISSTWNFRMQSGVSEALEDLPEAVSSVTEGVITTAKLTKYAIPVLVIGGAALFVYGWATSGQKIAKKVTGI
jgi:hypothetical protein